MGDVSCFRFLVTSRGNRSPPLTLFPSPSSHMSYHPYRGESRRRPPLAMQEQQDPLKMVKFTTPNISPDEVQFGDSLGKGSFGEVYRGICRGQPVAVKILNKQKLDEKSRKEFEREIVLISKYTHPNIVQFMGACLEPDKMMIVTELVPRGDLADMLADTSIHLSMPTRIKMARGAALGMNWLHLSEHTFIHRDLKTKNLLVGENNIIKICDFGLSQVKLSPNTIMKDPPNGAKGTPIWMAPEILCNQPFDEKCDVYSFGLILWSMLTREEPYLEYEDLNTFRTDICHRNVRPVIPNDCVPSLSNLIQRCWHRNPRNRPTFEEIVRELEYILVDYSIYDYIGRKLWVENFLSHDRVSWNEFSVALQNELEAATFLPPVERLNESHLQQATDFQLEELSTRTLECQRMAEAEMRRRYGPGGKPRDIYEENHRQERENQFYECLKALLAINSVEDGTVFNEPVVTIEKFGEMLNWFGPIVDEQGKVAIFDNLLDTAKHAWFHGDIDQSVAEDRIRANRTVGSFLVRFSSKPGFYTISQATSEGIEHRRISHVVGGKFTYGRQMEANTLEALIALLARPLHLQQPCPGSRFARIFLKEGPGGYVQTGMEM